MKFISLCITKYPHACIKVWVSSPKLKKIKCVDMLTLMVGAPHQLYHGYFLNSVNHIKWLLLLSNKWLHLRKKRAIIVVFFSH